MGSTTGVGRVSRELIAQQVMRDRGGRRVSRADRALVDEVVGRQRVRQATRAARVRQGVRNARRALLRRGG